MGMTRMKKGMGILLAFSLALNIGFIVTVVTQRPGNEFKGPGGFPKGKGPGMMVLSEMDLPKEDKAKVAEVLGRLRAGHMGIQQRAFEQQDKIIDLIRKPGPLSTEALEAEVLVLHGIMGDAVMDKPQYVIEIRELIGSEKAAELFSKVRGRFRKKMFGR
ncbi:MAG: hypothetical protein MI802_20655 [Desulfobacterales bacterium]|nr:hypothetical protein [Desulfobacterales bacterium]